MGKGKSSTDACSSLVGCVCCCISIIVVIIQMATSSNDAVEIKLNTGNSTSGVNGTAAGALNVSGLEKFGQWQVPVEERVEADNLQECVWRQKIGSVTYVYKCGGKCKRACGVCYPPEDGCVGTKYCALSCPLQTMCDQSDRGKDGDKFPGFNTKCKGMCGTNNTCVEPPDVKCYPAEHRFHLVMFLGCIVGILASVALDWLVDWDEKYFVPVLAMPLFPLCISAMAFLIKCSSTDLMSWKEAGITYSVLMSLALFYSFFSGSIVGKGPFDDVGLPWGVMPVIFFLCAEIFAVPICFIFYWEAKQVHWYNEDPYPGVADDFRCENIEAGFYAFWAAISLFLLLLLWVIWKIKYIEADKVANPLAGLVAPLFFTFITASSFSADCKNIGSSRLEPFGITLTAFTLMCFLWSTARTLVLVVSTWDGSVGTWSSSSRSGSSSSSSRSSPSTASSSSSGSSYRAAKPATSSSSSIRPRNDRCKGTDVIGRPCSFFAGKTGYCSSCEKKRQAEADQQQQQQVAEQNETPAPEPKGGARGTVAPEPQALVVAEAETETVGGGGAGAGGGAGKGSGKAMTASSCFPCWAELDGDAAKNGNFDGEYGLMPFVLVPFFIGAYYSAIMYSAWIMVENGDIPSL